MQPLSDDAIIDAWRANAPMWTTAVRDGRIASRRLVTDAAIRDAVLARAPGSVLDIGCGEGWLVRALATQVPQVVGVDAIPELVQHARAAGGGTFHVLSYDAIAAGALNARFDVAVCNFSLLGHHSVIRLCQSATTLLNPGGALMIQTLHPVAACGDAPYEDGWRQGSWQGIGTGFAAPAPWYFRTLGSWLALFTASGLRIAAMSEPLHPETRQPASVVFVTEAMLSSDAGNRGMDTP